MTLYCTRADLYAYGLVPGALPNPGRLIYSVSAGSNTFTLDDHGFQTGDVLTFRADVAGGSLPSPITEATEYYAIRVSDHIFSVSASSGGAAVDITTAGERVLVASAVPYDSSIAWASEVVNDALPAHIVPIPEGELIPEIIRMTTAEIAIGKLMSRQGAAADTLKMAVDKAYERLRRWARGVPVRGENVPPRAQVSASSASYIDARGWRTTDTI